MSLNRVSDSKSNFNHYASRQWLCCNVYARGRRAPVTSHATRRPGLLHMRSSCAHTTCAFKEESTWRTSHLDEAAPSYTSDNLFHTRRR